MLANIRVILLRPRLVDRQWLLVALASWAALQMAAIAYGRAAGPDASRYFDLYTTGVLLNGACLLYLVQAFSKACLRDHKAAPLSHFGCC